MYKLENIKNSTIEKTINKVLKYKKPIIKYNSHIILFKHIQKALGTTSKLNPRAIEVSVFDYKKMISYDLILLKHSLSRELLEKEYLDILTKMYSEFNIVINDNLELNEILIDKTNLYI